jgi:transposase
VPTGVSGVVVHDHWKPYYAMQGALHALCNAHHLRELAALIEIEKEEWAGSMRRLLRRACHAVNVARERGLVLEPGLIALFERRYDAIVAEGLAFHEAQTPLTRAAKKGGRGRGRKPRRPGHNLLARLQTRKVDVLRFLHDPDVPFSNNEAERDGRMAKVKQKISGGFRSKGGAEDFATLRSVISTAKKQGWDLIETLTRPAVELIAGLRIA